MGQADGSLPHRQPLQDAVSSHSIPTQPTPSQPAIAQPAASGTTRGCREMTCPGRDRNRNTVPAVPNGPVSHRLASASHQAAPQIIPTMGMRKKKSGPACTSGAGPEPLSRGALTVEAGLCLL